MSWQIKSFEELTTKELYQIVQARFEVFVMEQEITCENDFDDKDYKTHHIFRIEDDKVIAYARLLPRGLSYEQASIGRVLVRQEGRRRGLAKAMMEESIDFITRVWQEQDIVLSAQAYIVPLYKSVGFMEASAVYEEAGIPHVKMKYSAE